MTYITNTLVKQHIVEENEVVTLDLNESTTHNVIMPSGNITIAIENEQIGQVFSIRIVQDSVESGSVNWFDSIEWINNTEPPLIIEGGKSDLFVFVVIKNNSYNGFLAN